MKERAYLLEDFERVILATRTGGVLKSIDVTLGYGTIEEGERLTSKEHTLRLRYSSDDRRVYLVSEEGTIALVDNPALLRIFDFYLPRLEQLDWQTKQAGESLMHGIRIEGLDDLLGCITSHSP